MFFLVTNISCAAQLFSTNFKGRMLTQIGGLLLSYGAGTMAALSPCTSVLIPLLFYTLQQHTNSNSKKLLSMSIPKLLLIFTICFITGYIVLGYFIAKIFSSQLQNGFRMGLGLVFAVVGILNSLGRVNPVDIPLIKSPWFLGFSFAAITSLSPCTIPYLGLLVSVHGSGTAILWHLVLFASGLISPALVFAVIGRSFLSAVRSKSSSVVHKVNMLLSPMLALSGLYLMATTSSLGIWDLRLVVVLLLASLGLVVTAFLYFASLRDLVRPGRLLLLVALIAIVFAVYIHCQDHVSMQFEQDIPSSLDVSHAFEEAEEESMCAASTHCFVCKRCTIIFVGTALLGLIGAVLVNTYEDRKVKKQ